MAAVSHSTPPPVETCHNMGNGAASSPLNHGPRGQFPAPNNLFPRHASPSEFPLSEGNCPVVDKGKAPMVDLNNQHELVGGLATKPNVELDPSFSPEMDSDLYFDGHGPVIPSPLRASPLFSQQLGLAPPGFISPLGLVVQAQFRYGPSGILSSGPFFPNASPVNQTDHHVPGPFEAGPSNWGDKPPDYDISGLAGPGTIPPGPFEAGPSNWMIPPSDSDPTGRSSAGDSPVLSLSESFPLTPDVDSGYIQDSSSDDFDLLVGSDVSSTTTSAVVQGVPMVAAPDMGTVDMISRFYSSGTPHLVLGSFLVALWSCWVVRNDVRFRGSSFSEAALSVVFDSWSARLKDVVRFVVSPGVPESGSRLQDPPPLLFSGGLQGNVHV
ncbi:hypothetical protein SOVF_001250 [Spinacia oleracea]|nr:hypothetical protein SOVF_001250 [Spinacia oleracea]